MALDLKNLTPLGLLQAHLIGDQTDTLAAQDIDKDPRRFEAKQRLLKALDPKTDQTEARNIVHELATEFYDDALKPFNVTAESVANEFEKTQGAAFEQTQQPEPQQQESPEGRGRGFLESLINEGTKSTIAGRTGDSATPALHGLQEEELVRDYEDAVARGDDTEIGRLEKEALGLDGEQGLLQRQLALAKEHIGQLTPEQLELYNIDRRKLAEDMEKQWTERKAKEDARRQKPMTPAEKEAEEKRAAREKELRDKLAEATESGDKDKRIAAFRQLARHRIAQTQAYSPIAHYYEIQEDGMMFPLQVLMGETMKKIAIARARQREARANEEETVEVEHVQQVQGQQQAQRQQPKGNPLMSFVRNAGKGEARSLAKQGFKKLLSKGLEKAAASNPWTFAAFEIWKNRKAVIAIILLLLLMIFILVVSIIAAFSAINNNTQQDDATPIPGLTLTLNTNPPDKTSYNNGQNIDFVIDVTYTGSYSIYIVDENPDNAVVVPGSVTGVAKQDLNEVAWSLDDNTPLPDSTSSQRHWQFHLTFSQVGKDTVFHNVVTAQYLPGSGPNNNVVTSQYGTDGAASGYCSASNLAKYFGSTDAGKIASCICKYESGGDPGVINKDCTKGGSADWSVGLFQINLDTNPQRCSGAFSQTGLVCKVANQTKLNSCTTSLTDPTVNINAAVGIYQAGHGWDSGWHAEKGKCF